MTVVQSEGMVVFDLVDFRVLASVSFTYSVDELLMWLVLLMK